MLTAITPTMQRHECAMMMLKASIAELKNSSDALLAEADRIGDVGRLETRLSEVFHNYAQHRPNFSQYGDWLKAIDEAAAKRK